jgi:stage V sporulation protein R
MREMRMFHLCDDPEETAGIRVSAIHDERGFRRLRRTLADQYDVGRSEPNIEIVDVDLEGDRRLILRHKVVDGRLLEAKGTAHVLQHLADLWGYDVVLYEVDGSDDICKEHTAEARG